MHLEGNSIEGNIAGKPLLTFNPELTRQAKYEIATKIEHMDKLFQLAEQLVSSAHIVSVADNMALIQKELQSYKSKLFERKRRINGETE